MELKSIRAIDLSIVNSKNKKLIGLFSLFSDKYLNKFFLISFRNTIIDY